MTLEDLMSVYTHLDRMIAETILDAYEKGLLPDPE